MCKYTSKDYTITLEIDLPNHGAKFNVDKNIQVFFLSFSLGFNDKIKFSLHQLEKSLFVSTTLFDIYYKYLIHFKNSNTEKQHWWMRMKKEKSCNEQI